MEDQHGSLVPRRTRLMEPVALDGSPIREITVNGTQHLIKGDSIAHEEIAHLAYPDIAEDQRRMLTVAYRGGPLHDPEGLLPAGRRVSLVMGETFVVARTSAS